jgi:MerR family transcriptional regulator, light-induced transcriptional regulator
LNPEQRYVGTATVAKAFGVSVTTVKRWVDEGILAAHKTAGGHRKVMLADVTRLVREGKLPQGDLSSLYPVANSVDTSTNESIREQLAYALRKADTELTRSLIHESYRQGVSVEVLADTVIGPVMTGIGHDWEKGRLDVMHEHRATQCLIQALYEMKWYIRSQIVGDRPVAVGGAPEHDPYLLPTLLAKMVLLDNGWDAINLGPHTPASAFTTAIDELKPRLIWLSVSHIKDETAFLSEYLSMYQRAEARGIAVAIGGFALTRELRERMPYTSYGDKLGHLASFARNLHRMPDLPKRGRPRKDEDALQS